MDMGRGGEGEMYGKNNMETYITICKIAQGNLLYGSGNSNRDSVSTYTPQGWGGEGDGREVQKGGNVCIPMTEFMLNFDRKQQNSAKQLSFNKK